MHNKEAVGTPLGIRSQEGDCGGVCGRNGRKYRIKFDI